MVDDDETIETDALFTRPIRTLFGKAFRHSWFRHVPKLTYAVLVGRNVTTNTQTLDRTMDSNGLRVHERGADFPDVATAFPAAGASNVGDWLWLGSAPAAPAADIDLPSSNPTGTPEEIWEILTVLAGYVRDATAQTIVFSVGVNIGGTRSPGTYFEYRSGNVSITAGQTGTILVAPFRTALNANGTMTFEDAPGRLLVNPYGTTMIRLDITSGTPQATDTNTLYVLLRRVA